MVLGRRYRHLARYREVANILAKHGFGYLIGQLGLRELLPRWSERVQTKQRARLTAPQRVFYALEELGPTFVKLGQILSTRPDLIPREYIVELERLQDDVPPFPFEQVQEVIRQDQGKEITELYREFQPTPLASASIGQVHRAVLISGEEVVVKVQRPMIQQVIETDLEIMFDLARLLEARTSWGKFYRLVDIVEEFATSLLAELDYTVEGRNADRFKKMFTDDPTVYIPQVYWEYSTKRVLILEYVEAIKVSAVERLIRAGYSREKVAQNAVNALLKQIYVYGFFHADPHPGNLGVLPGERIVFMDFGQVGRIDAATREKAVDMILAMVRYDVGGVMRSLLDIGIAQHTVNKQVLRRDLTRLQEKYYGLPLSQISVGEALQELVDLSFKHQIRIPAEFTMVIKSLITMEGLVKQLDPKISMLDVAEPFARKLVRGRLTAQRLQRRALEALGELYGIMTRVPQQVENILGQVEEGELRLQLEHRNLNRVMQRLNIIANRIALSIMIAGLIVGSSLIAQRADAGSLWSLQIAEGGFVVAMAMGLWLIVAIFRTGRF